MSKTTAILDFCFYLPVAGVEQARGEQIGPVLEVVFAQFALDLGGRPACRCDTRKLLSVRDLDAGDETSNMWDRVYVNAQLTCAESEQERHVERRTRHLAANC